MPPLLENIHIGPVVDGAKVDWRKEPDNSPDDDEGLDKTPDDVIALLGFDPLREGDE